MKTDKERKAGAAAYRELMEWAVRQVADSVIHHGFSEIRGTLMRQALLAVMNQQAGSRALNRLWHGIKEL